MDGMPQSLARSIAILDGRPEYARMLASLVAEHHRDISVELFNCPDAAQQWVEGAAGPVVVLVDVAASNGLFIERALEWRVCMDVVLIAMFDERTEDDVERASAVQADATFAKPYCKAMWADSFGAFLRDTLITDRAAPPAQRSA
jgi:hypothetical protein